MGIDVGRHVDGRASGTGSGVSGRVRFWACFVAMVTSAVVSVAVGNSAPVLASTPIPDHADGPLSAIDWPIAAGVRNTANGYRPFVYDFSSATPTKRIDLDGPILAHTIDVDVDGEVIVGSSYLSDQAVLRSFAYDLGASTPTVIDLGARPGATSGESVRAVGVSGHLVIGNTYDGQTGGLFNHALMYDLDAVVPGWVELDGLVGAGEDRAQAEAISGKIVVGTIFPAIGSVGPTRGFAFDAARGVAYDLAGLAPPGAAVAAVHSIDLTTIVGDLLLADGETHAFVADLAAPVPAARDLGGVRAGVGSTGRLVKGSIVVGRPPSEAGDSPPVVNEADYFDLAAPEFGWRRIANSIGGDYVQPNDTDGRYIVGYESVPGGQDIGHAFVYDTAAAAPATRDLAPFDFLSDARAVSDGIAVGYSDDATVWDLAALPADGDSDGVPDEIDNCPTVTSPDVTDTDGDGLGDVCDDDDDGDGFADVIDDRPLHPDLLVNGTFDSGGATFTPWIFRHDVAATLTGDVSGNGSRAAKVTVSATSPQPWHVQLREEGVQLHAGTTYTVVYSARASAPRLINARIQSPVAPYPTMVAHDEQLTTQWQQFALTYTATTDVADAFVGFNLAQATGDVWIDDVTIYAGTNLIANASFESGGPAMSPWFLRNDLGATLERDTSQRQVGRASAKITVPTIGRPHEVQWRTPIQPLVALQRYRVSFAVKASVPRTLNVRVQSVIAPYPTSVQRNVAVTSEWTRLTFEWQPSTSVASPFFGFNLATATGMIWIDDVVMIAVR
jgi:Carbohydrate binding domain/Thrombospondin type 3 repeat